jgi:hypothetical protein
LAETIPPSMLGNPAFRMFPGVHGGDGANHPSFNVTGITSNFAPVQSNMSYSGFPLDWQSKECGPCHPATQTLFGGFNSCLVQNSNHSRYLDRFYQRPDFKSGCEFFGDVSLPAQKPFVSMTTFLALNSSSSASASNKPKDFRVHDTSTASIVSSTKRLEKSAVMSVEGLLNPSTPMDSVPFRRPQVRQQPHAKFSISEAPSRKPHQDFHTENRKRPAENQGEEEAPNKRKWKVVLTPELAVTVFRQKPRGNAKKSSSINLSQT